VDPDRGHTIAGHQMGHDPNPMLSRSSIGTRPARRSCQTLAAMEPLMIMLLAIRPFSEMTSQLA
jgi:hypothetical protein